MRMSSITLERTTGGFGFNIQRQIVVKITPGGVADKAGLKKGQTITHVNGNDVSSLSHMQMIGLVKSAGNKLELSVREGTAPPPESVLTTHAPSTQPQKQQQTSKPKQPPTQQQQQQQQKHKSSQPAQPAAKVSSSLPPPRKSSLPPPKASSIPKQDKEEPVASKKVSAPPPTTVDTATTNLQPSTASSTKKVDEGEEGKAKGNEVKGNEVKVKDTDKEPKKKWEKDPNADRKMFFKGKNGEVMMMHTPRCAGCNELIISSYVEFDKKKFHDKCFVCSRCNCSLKETGFSKEGDSVLCPTCWNNDNGVVCAGCGQFIVPDIDSLVPYMSIGDRHYHQACLKCEVCGVQFGDGVPGPFSVVGALLCKPHAVERKRAKGGNNTTNTGTTKSDGSIVEQSKKGWR
eukprot:m.83064 g.83064  ORF g.83064 m.83064 type:complete len:402 (-) comp12110_c0_seq1:1874-3079(-)